MIFWIFVRSCKYMMPENMAVALRMGWYLYYIPMLLSCFLHCVCESRKDMFFRIRFICLIFLRCCLSHLS